MVSLSIVIPVYNGAQSLRELTAQLAETLPTLADSYEIIFVEDDGKGFNPAQQAPGHFGMIGLSERARLLGGKLDLETGPGEGPRVTVSVPLK